MVLITILTMIFIIAMLICSYIVYVSIIQKKNKVEEALASIDVQLKKRYDLIPNILTMANKFMNHEKELFEKVTELRTQAMQLPNNTENINKKIELDSEIKSLMGQILVAVENYPELKSDQTMLTAMQTYNEVEEHIAAARRFYNSAVLELNNSVEIFPSSLIALIIGVKKQEFFKANENEKKSINAADYLK